MKNNDSPISMIKNAIFNLQAKKEGVLRDIKYHEDEVTRNNSFLMQCEKQITEYQKALEVLEWSKRNY